VHQGWEKPVCSPVQPQDESWCEQCRARVEASHFQVESLSANAGAQCVCAEEPDLEQQIVNALKAGPLTRGLSNSTRYSATHPQRRQLIESLPTTRSLSVREREEVATGIKNRPRIDLEIFFDFRSAELGKQAMPSVIALGRALTNPALKGDTEDSYNQKLSRLKGSLSAASRSLRRTW
jgi:hypothetical protein